MDALLLVAIGLIHIPLLLPTRDIPYDEMPCADSAIGALEKPYVPRAQFWSHVLPEIGVINFLYTPLYFYLLAVFLKALGIRPLAAGFLHALLRLASTGVIWAAGHQMGLPHWTNAMIALTWSVFCHGPVGRPDDLSLLFLSGCYYLVVAREPGFAESVLGGVLMGLAFLTYPAAGINLLVIGAAIVLRRSLPSAIGVGVIVGVIAGAVSLVWLVWIIPFWKEFKATFLDFALPDAKASSRVKSLQDILKWSFRGVNSSPLPFHYSLVPLMTLLGVGLSYEAHDNMGGVLLVLGVMLAFAVYLSGLRIHKTYNLLYLIVAISWFVQITLSDNVARWKDHPVIQVVLVAALAYQVLGSLVLAALRLIGTYSLRRESGLGFHAPLFTHIPPGERVLTDQGLAFYVLRARNPIYAPVGLSGVTPGQVAFEADYDDTFRWLVLASPLTRDDINPGAKFAWNKDTFAFYRQQFKLIHISSLPACKSDAGIARFAGQVRDLYLYQRTASKPHAS